MNEFIQGKCMEMCPREEIALREKEKLLNILEILPGTENHKYPKASYHHTVKAFSRSAAGKHIKAETVRPPQILLKTVNYLLSNIVSTKIIPWHKVYDFITDRLLAVRQDLVVQNASVAESVTILQPIVRFHAYAAYKLCNASTANFDPTLNNKHLQECLKKLLSCYDHLNLVNDYLTETRPEFEALYLVFNLGDDEALMRPLTIPKIYRTKTVKRAMQMSLCCKYGNFVRVCRIMQDLPPLLALLASLQLPKVRRKAFEVMAVAYNSKNLTFPGTYLTNLLLYGTVDEMLRDCNYYGFKTDENLNVLFAKDSFNSNKIVSPRRELFIEDQLVYQNVDMLILGK